MNTERYNWCVTLALGSLDDCSRIRENIPNRRVEHIYYKNTVFLLRKCSINNRLGLGWHTRHRTTWSCLHRVFLSGMLPLPLPYCSLPCLSKVHACSTLAKAQSWPFHAKNVVLGSPSVPADKCPSFPQNHSAPAVSQGFLETPELRKTQNTAIHKAKLSNNELVFDILLLLTGTLNSSPRTGGIVSPWWGQGDDTHRPPGRVVQCFEGCVCPST